MEPSLDHHEALIERRAVSVRGIVQGVGFRPFVQRWAEQHRLVGFVRNRSGWVLIEIEGSARSLDAFLTGLVAAAPPLARIESLDWERKLPLGEQTFQIAASDSELSESVFIPPDVATCADCLRELFDPADRRYRYPFLNCTNCGPRLTIIRGAPYDRPLTTMAAFSLCVDCQREYEDSRDRRFHAQPIACPACGPHLELRTGNGEAIHTDDPLAEFCRQLLEGRIGAVKGLGGFHLVCDARRETVVQSLRNRKRRNVKPLAIMVRDLVIAGELCELNDAERALLSSPRAPIVLLRRRSSVGGDGALSGACEAVAPGHGELGVMLPYTPLHHLLMDGVGNIPLVMTSGNLADEPIAIDNEDALARLAGTADLFLLHDRPIRVRCDDSITRVVDGIQIPVRRSRGDAPRPIRLTHATSAPLLAVGGQLKNVFAVARGEFAFLSQHMGDLDDFTAFQAFEKDISLFEELFQVHPELLVHDLHPDYATTRYARARSTREGLATVAVQHHHAHIASCMAEHGLVEPVIGVAWDGTGYGVDEISGEATVWGGEFLVGDLRSMRRATHLRNVPMPGGESAIREPWRMAAAWLAESDRSLTLLESRIDTVALRNISSMLKSRFNSPLTSSMGRLFDAVASLIGLRDRVSYEGQAAMELESLATGSEAAETYAFEIESSSAPGRPEIIDVRPMIREIALSVDRGVDLREIARRFHTSLVSIINGVCRRIRGATGLNSVVLSGGVFMNSLLVSESERTLTDAGFHVYRHRLVPPNDGGLCLGQVAVACARLAK